jgi:hypothetical protein
MNGGGGGPYDFAGGGGGYFGGGAAFDGGGGGGASYPAAATLWDTTATPSVTITYTVPLATPSISTIQEPASATVGSSIADKAAVSGGDSPSGTVTFNLYNNSTASGTPLFTDANVAFVSGQAATSTGYTATATGTDYWVATYNGDTNNSSVSSGAALEPVTITPASPSINTSQQPASATVGTSIADKATVTGGDSPTGSVTFKLYSNSTASGTPLFTSAPVTLSSGTATSPGYTATATGTDYWVATYNGDSNNYAVTSGLAAEPVTITAALPSISTSQQPGSATVGTSVADKATVSGGDIPSGTVTFNLYSNSTGTGPALFTDTETLSGGVATSKGYTATATGTDYWVATYNGNTNNNSVSSGLSSEPVTITKALTSLRAWPQLVELEPFVGVGSQTVQATLTSGGSPVSGQTVYFTEGSTALCQATTNGAGVARCYISWNNQSLLYRTNHYTATFDGTPGYTTSTSTTLVVTFIL